MTVVQIDASEIFALADDLTAAAAGLIGKVRPSISKGSLNVKKQMQKELTGSPSFYGAAWTVGYDITEGPGWVESKIGPTTGRGKGTGAIANIAYFGGAHGGGHTVADPQGAADAEAPNLEKYLLAIVDGLL